VPGSGKKLLALIAYHPINEKKGRGIIVDVTAQGVPSITLLLM